MGNRRFDTKRMKRKEMEITIGMGGFSENFKFKGRAFENLNIKKSDGVINFPFMGKLESGK